MGTQIRVEFQAFGGGIDSRQFATRPLAESWARRAGYWGRPHTTLTPVRASAAVRATELLHLIGDRMEERLASVLRSAAIPDDLDDMREEYVRWFGEDNVTARYSRVENLL